MDFYLKYKNYQIPVQGSPQCVVWSKFRHWLLRWNLSKYTQINCNSSVPLPQLLHFVDVFKDRILFTDWDMPNILVLCNRFFCFTICDHWLLRIFLLGWIKLLFVLVPHAEFVKSTSRTGSFRNLQWEVYFDFHKQATKWKFNTPKDTHGY